MKRNGKKLLAAILAASFTISFGMAGVLAADQQIGFTLKSGDLGSPAAIIGSALTGETHVYTDLAAFTAALGEGVGDSAWTAQGDVSVFEKLYITPATNPVPDPTNEKQVTILVLPVDKALPPGAGDMNYPSVDQADIMYIDQDAYSSTAALEFAFKLRQTVKANGIYAIKVGGEGITSPTIGYVKTAQFKPAKVASESPSFEYETNPIELTIADEDVNNTQLRWIKALIADATSATYKVQVADGPEQQLTFGTDVAVSEQAIASGDSTGKKLLIWPNKITLTDDLFTGLEETKNVTLTITISDGQYKDFTTEFEITVAEEPVVSASPAPTVSPDIAVLDPDDEKSDEVVITVRSINDTFNDTALSDWYDLLKTYGVGADTGEGAEDGIYFGSTRIDKSRITFGDIVDVGSTDYDSSVAITIPASALGAGTDDITMQVYGYETTEAISIQVLGAMTYIKEAAIKAEFDKLQITPTTGSGDGSPATLKGYLFEGDTVTGAKLPVAVTVAGKEISFKWKPITLSDTEQEGNDKVFGVTDAGVFTFDRTKFENARYTATLTANTFTFDAGGERIELENSDMTIDVSVYIDGNKVLVFGDFLGLSTVEKGSGEDDEEKAMTAAGSLGAIKLENSESPNYIYDAALTALEIATGVKSPSDVPNPQGLSLSGDEVPNMTDIYLLKQAALAERAKTASPDAPKPFYTLQDIIKANLQSN